MEMLLAGDNIQHLLLCRGDCAPAPGMYPLPGLNRHKAVGVEVILFQPKRAILAVEISGAITLYPLAKNKVLRPSGSANWISLHKPQAIHSAPQTSLGKQGSGQGMMTQVAQRDL